MWTQEGCMGRAKVDKKKNKNMNVKFFEDDYKELVEIAEEIGGMSLSAMIRQLVYSRLNKVRKTGKPDDFFPKED